MCLIKLRSCSISQSIAMFMIPFFLGQSLPNLVLARLEDLVFQLDDLRSILCVHMTALRNLGPAKLFLLIVIPG